MKKLIVGNWKMNPQSRKEAVILFKAIAGSLANIKNIDIVICPPAPFLPVFRALKNKKIMLGAQNAFYEPKGAYTGEVSTAMVYDMGARFVILGHSERRAFGETDEVIQKKILAALKTGLAPIICVGESIRTHDASYFDIVKKQLVSCLTGIGKSQIKNIIIAYEPVWALSSTENRRDATPHDFEEMKIYIRKILADMFGQGAATSVKILYGGSANKDNAEAFLKIGADGLMPGKASLDPRNFARIIHIAATIK
jgi:triosephosphate isomerase